MLGVAPSQDASDHQDDITFLGSGIPKKLHFPLLLGGGRSICYSFSTRLPLAEEKHTQSPNEVTQQEKKDQSLLLGGTKQGIKHYLLSTILIKFRGILKKFREVPSELIKI